MHTQNTPPHPGAQPSRLQMLPSMFYYLLVYSKAARAHLHIEAWGAAHPLTYLN